MMNDAIILQEPFVGERIYLNRGLAAIVDPSDYHSLSNTKYKWLVRPHGKTHYAYRKVRISSNNWTIERMHNAIMHPPDGMEVDHINGNGLDNRRDNLRVVSHQVNCQNQHIESSSKFLGVGWHKAAKKWRAYIRLNGKTRHIGLFNDESDASTAYRVTCAVLIGGSS